MEDKRDFTTLPRRALGDRRLSGMDLRVLGAISLHDGRSLEKTGQGCWAGDRKLAQVANTDRKNVKRSTARLIEFGYLQRDSDTGNRRGFVMRVIPDSMAEPIGGEFTPYGQGASSPPRGGELTPSTGGELTPRIETGIEPEKNHGIDSAKAAHVAERDMRHDHDFPENVIGFPGRSEPDYVDQSAVRQLIGNTARASKPAEEREPCDGLQLLQFLPRTGKQLPAHAVLARFERVYKSGVKAKIVIDRSEADVWRDYLGELAERWFHDEDESVHCQAQRLACDFDSYPLIADQDDALSHPAVQQLTRPARASER